MVRDLYFNTVKGVLGSALPFRAVIAERTRQRVEGLWKTFVI